MSIFFPIGDGGEQGARATVSGSTTITARGSLRIRGASTVAGSTTIAAVGSLLQHRRASVRGKTTITARATLAVRSEVAIAGRTQVTARGRTDAPSGILGAAIVASSTSIAARGTVTTTSGGARIEGRTQITAQGRVAVPEEFGFTIFLDVVNTALDLRRGTRYRVRLTADGVEVPITSYALRAPRNVIGSSLTLRLARPDPDLISRTASLKFEIGVRQPGGDGYEWVTYLEGGRLAGREATIGMSQSRPTDTVQVSAFDFLGDRWTLAPSRPRTLYDPDRVSAAEIGDTAGGLVKDDNDTPVTSFKGFAAPDVITTESGAPVTPVRVPVDDLSLRRALRAAYVDGCGFNDVLTNIPDFPVSRVDFTPFGGSYHAGIRPLLALYEPLFHAGDDGTLWITDPDELSIATLSPRQLPLSAVLTVKSTLPARQFVDGLVVSYQLEEGAAEIVIGDRFENETTRSGDSETTTRRRIRKYGSPSEPGVVTREATIETTTTVRGADGDIIHRETQADTFDALNRKSGHTRTVESRVPDLENDGEMALLEVVEEKCSISYRPHPTRPRAYVQDLCVTETRGLIHSDLDNTYRDEPFRVPMTDAHRNGYVDAGANQTSSFARIKTATETLRVREDGELDVSVIVIDELANPPTTERSSSTPRVGAIGGDSRRNNVRRVLLLADGVETITRSVPEISGGELSRDLLLPLGRRKLRRLNNPPDEVSIELPGLDVSIRRGSLVEPHTRSGASGVFIVEAYESRGERLGTAGQAISMSLDCVKAGG